MSIIATCHGETPKTHIKSGFPKFILQQTRVAQGLPYYEKFILNFSNVKSLAKAKERDVLRLWQGLGYYTRARNLHKCAQEVVKNFNGKFPKTFRELKQLPGIGDYTAAAIASFAFNEPVAVVDGNVYRVLSRVFGIDKNIASPEGKIFFSKLANQLISKDEPALQQPGSDGVWGITLPSSKPTL